VPTTPICLATITATMANRNVEELQQASSTPIHPLPWSLTRDRSVQVAVKRDEQLFFPEAPGLMGNKWHKLRFNLQQAASAQYRHLLTFGGAYSNHIAAVAAAGKLFGFQTQGIIRGERPKLLNPTLRRAKADGMDLQFVSRNEYRSITRAAPAALQERYPEYFILPEGGSNALAVRGAEALGQQIRQQGWPATHLALCAGTGGTAAGLIRALGKASNVLVVPVLKGAAFLRDDINSWLPADAAEWTLLTTYHFGGYAKFTEALLQFIHQQYRDYSMMLDPIYTAKLFYAVHDLIEQDYFPPGSRILLYHSGGLQGLAGFNERFGLKLPE